MWLPVSAISLRSISPIFRAFQGTSITQKGLKNTVLTESNRGYSTNKREKVLTHIYIYISLSTLCICMIKSDSVQSLFYSVDGASYPRLHSAHSSRKLSEKWKWKSKSAGGGRTIGFYWKSNGTIKVFNLSASFPPSLSPTSLSLANPSLVLSSIGSAEWPFTFFLCSLRSSREYYLNRVLIAGTEASVNAVDRYDVTPRQRQRQSARWGASQQFNPLWHPPFPRESHKVTLAHKGGSLGEHIVTRANIIHAIKFCRFCCHGDAVIIF